MFYHVTAGFPPASENEKPDVRVCVIADLMELVGVIDQLLSDGATVLIGSVSSDVSDLVDLVNND